MEEFDPAPDAGDDGIGRSRWQAGSDTFDRVYRTLLGTTDPTPYGEIADVASCSPNAARKHLDRLVEMGIARIESGSRPARYERNDGYLEWQRANRIAAERSIDELTERVRQLEAEREEYESRFDARDPASASALDGDDHASVHERMEAIADWHATVRDIRLYELARQLARNDGHLVPANAG